nr:hypothetical protein [Tanacetum cinerariifolium]
MATKGSKTGVAYKGSSGSRGCLYAQLHGLWRKSFTIMSQLWFILIGLMSLETDGDDAALMSIDSKGTNVRVRQVKHTKVSMQKRAWGQFFFFFWMSFDSFLCFMQGFTKDVAEKSKLSLMICSLEPVDITSCPVCEKGLDSPMIGPSKHIQRPTSC